MFSESKRGFEIRCDCCGREKLAEFVDGKLIIMDGRHGQKHIVAITMAELQEKVLTKREILI